MGLLVRLAGQTCWTGQLDRPAGHSSWTDQLDRPARQTSWQTSWTDQFFLFKALASLHIRRFSFQFVHCRSFRVRRRPCFFGTYIIINEWDKCVAENFWVLFDILNHPIVSRLCDTLIYNVSRLRDTTGCFKKKWCSVYFASISATKHLIFK